MEYKMEKRGQVFIFVIVAILIIVGISISFYFFPSSNPFSAVEQNPKQFLKTCLEGDSKQILEQLGKQGGSINPELYYTYKNEKIEYLCYSELEYSTCVVQRPLLIQHVTSELKREIKDSVNLCINDLNEYFKNRGYSVEMSNTGFELEMIPKNIRVSVNGTLLLTKGGETRRYTDLQIDLDHNLYTLLVIAQDITYLESILGDSETTTYMNYYPNVKVEKLKRTDGTKIYTLTEREDGTVFRFVSKSLNWPAGTGWGELR